MTTRRAVYPGSFDPVTLGHLDILARAVGLFDEVVVAVMQHPVKAEWFSAAERVALLAEAAAPWPTVQVEASGELLAEYARRIGARVVVRGVRHALDLVDESAMSWMNHVLNPDLDTVYLLANPALAHISSSRARELARFGSAEGLAGLVPAHVAHALMTKQDREGRP